MLIREIRPQEKDIYNKVVAHPLQSWEWGEFRTKTGVEVIRLGEFQGQALKSGIQITFHKLPNLPFAIGYSPRSHVPSQEMMTAIKQLAQQKKAVFVKLEPNIYQIAQPKTDHPTPPNPSSVVEQTKKYLFEQNCVFGKPLFTKYDFLLDLRLPQEQLKANMKQKTRYNVGVAQKKGVQVSIDNSPEAFQEYLRLTFEETTKRQKFYAHDREYHTNMWENMSKAGIAQLIKATYQDKTLVTWIVFIFNGVIYYPYGASSREHRNLMASNLVAWNAIQLGQQQGCSIFDMWGALGPNPDPKDPWIGFHKFKQGYGATLMEFAGTYDLVINSPQYQLYKIADKVRWALLKLKANLPF